MTQQKQIQLGNLRLWVQSLASLSGLRIRHCHKLWCRSQMRLGSGVAVALGQAGSCSSNWTPSLGTSTYHRCGPKKQTKKKGKGNGFNLHIHSSLPLLSPPWYFFCLEIQVLPKFCSQEERRAQETPCTSHNFPVWVYYQCQ